MNDGSSGAQMRAVGRLALGTVLALLPGCVKGNSSAAIAEVDRVLDDWHRAAAEADEQRYLGLMTADAVFLGTDPGERWTAEQFREFVRPYFDEGQGWTYRPRDRHVMLSEGGALAWFDERLDNEKYGELRGTGVLRCEDGVWKIAHYNMSFPIPNERTRQVVDLIRSGVAAESPE
jgi:ketosteroid isomerase-like protein